MPRWARVTARVGGGGVGATTAGGLEMAEPDGEEPDEEVPVAEPSMVDAAPTFERDDGALDGETREPPAEDPTPEYECCMGAHAEPWDADRPAGFEAAGSARTQGGDGAIGTRKTVGAELGAGGGAMAVTVGEANGNTSSWKTTCRDVNTRREVGSKHRYPRWSGGYPRKTHAVDR